MRQGGEDLLDYDRCDLNLGETLSHAFYNCLRVRLFWDYVDDLTAYTAPDKFVLTNLSYACNSVSLTYSGVKRMFFLTLLAVARRVIWAT